MTNDKCEKCAYWQNTYSPTPYETEVDNFGGYSCGHTIVKRCTYPPCKCEEEK